MDEEREEEAKWVADKKEMYRRRMEQYLAEEDAWATEIKLAGGCPWREQALHKCRAYRAELEATRRTEVIVPRRLPPPRGMLIGVCGGSTEGNDEGSVMQIEAASQSASKATSRQRRRQRPRSPCGFLIRGRERVN